jgi:hypothetical protein
MNPDRTQLTPRKNSKSVVHCPTLKIRVRAVLTLGDRKNFLSSFSYPDFLTDIAKHVECSNLGFFVKQVPN